MVCVLFQYMSITMGHTNLRRHRTNLVVSWSPGFLQSCVISDDLRLTDRVSEEEMNSIQAFFFKTCNYTRINGVSDTQNV
jgi:hypothetical protein